MKLAGLVSILMVSISLAGGCGHGGTPIQGTETTPIPGNAGATERVLETIKIATFNIQNFGKTKVAKPEVMKVLAEIVRKYDMVAIQEVSDVTEKTAPALLKTIEEQGGTYAFELSQRSGTTASSSAQEQYAYFYRTSTIEADGEGGLYEDTNDQFRREPYVARFKAKHGSFTFVLMSIHTEPKTTVAEIDALADVFVWAASKYPQEDDFIALGDFNAGCSYASPAKLDATRLRQPGFTWVVPDDADTNLASKDCAYDRIVFRDGTTADYSGTWGIDKAFEDPAVSDHWPVWAEFRVDRDQGN